MLRPIHRLLHLPLDKFLYHKPTHIDAKFLTKSVFGITGASVALFAFWIAADYQAWIAFGTGGTPPTLSGYWRMTKIRISRLFAKDSLTDSSLLNPIGPKHLDINLPDRTGRRPAVQSRTMPQRQVPQPIDEKVRERLHALPSKYCTEHADILKLDLSHTEGRSTDGIYALENLSGRYAGAKDQILKNEIAHAHPADNSLHVWLSEADAREVVRKGWGERFPLSFVHPGWVFVYAPETTEDVDVIEEIIKAGIAHLTGKKI